MPMSTMIRFGEVSSEDAMSTMIQFDSVRYLPRMPMSTMIRFDSVRYLLMVRQKVKEPIYAYAKTDRVGEIEEFILIPNV
ncbi:hypothetical protein V6N13_060715 [Hibiscus sabdariffa]